MRQNDDQPNEGTTPTQTENALNFRRWQLEETRRQIDFLSGAIIQAARIEKRLTNAEFDFLVCDIKDFLKSYGSNGPSKVANSRVKMAFERLDLIQHKDAQFDEYKIAEMDLREALTELGRAKDWLLKVVEEEEAAQKLAAERAKKAKKPTKKAAPFA